MKIFFNKKFSTKTKLISSAISLMLIVCFAITGTVAWLIDTSGPVEDTFTFGKVDIELLDGDALPTKWDSSAHANNPTYDGTKFKLIPGAPIKFNPVVRVVKDSEACFVFVEITEANNVLNEIDVFGDSVGTAWTPLEGETGVYYQVVNAVASDTDLNVFTNGTFTVPNTLTNAAAGTADATMTIKAYAIQKDYLNAGNNATAAEAWALVKDSTTVYPAP